jgi:small subunit ribosomal protein S16
VSVVIRLHRAGRRNAPFYRVVASDSRERRDGRFLEVVGTYNPTESENAIRLNRTKIDSWLKKGATPSDTVKRLIRQDRAAKKENP